MNEQIYGMSVGTGVILSTIWLSIYILSWLSQWLWAVIDDAKVSKDNWIVFKLMTAYNWKAQEKGEIWGWRKNKRGSDGFGPWFTIWAILMFTPFFALLCFDFYVVTLILLLTWFTGWIARASRRTFKKLNAHITDSNAHKDGGV